VSLDLVWCADETDSGCVLGRCPFGYFCNDCHLCSFGLLQLSLSPSVTLLFIGTRGRSPMHRLKYLLHLNLHQYFRPKYSATLVPVNTNLALEQSLPLPLIKSSFDGYFYVPYHYAFIIMHTKSFPRLYKRQSFVQFGLS
jgi:hypothetical protein